MINVTIKIGDMVEYRRDWGRGGYFEARVMNIEVGSPRQEVSEISWEDHEEAIFIMNDGHWCSGYQIQAVIPPFCPYCGEQFEDEEGRDRCGCPESQKARDLDRELDEISARRKGE